MRRREQLRRALNWINLSTACGFLLAKLSHSDRRPTPDGHYLATSYHWPVPVAGAFTIGDVIFTRSAHSTNSDPYSPLDAHVWSHELMHSNQYAWCLGLPFIPLYFSACAYSYLMSGDIWSYNIFETRANLDAGGYVKSQRRAAITRFTNSA